MKQGSLTIACQTTHLKHYLSKDKQNNKDVWEGQLDIQEGTRQPQEPDKDLLGKFEASI